MHKILVHSRSNSLAGRLFRTYQIRANQRVARINVSWLTPTTGCGSSRSLPVVCEAGDVRVSRDNVDPHLSQADAYPGLQTLLQETIEVPYVKWRLKDQIDFTLTQTLRSALKLSNERRRSGFSSLIHMSPQPSTSRRLDSCRYTLVGVFLCQSAARGFCCTAALMESWRFSSFTQAALSG